MKKTSFLFAFFFACLSVCVASTSNLSRALDSYARSDWKGAIKHLQNAINNAKSEEEIETSLYYLVMSLASSGNYKNAVNSANMFISRYPKSSKKADIVYQRARLYCLLSLHNRSLKEFHNFVQKYPTHRSIPSAYYWIGENLYLSGKLKEGRDVFSRVLLNYPTSPKAELAKQRISLIDQVATQRELLALLQLTQAEAVARSNKYEKSQKDLEKTLKERILLESQKMQENKTSPIESEKARYDDSQLEEMQLNLQEERAKNTELYEKLLVLEAKNKELLDALAMLDDLENVEKGEAKDEDAQSSSENEEGEATKPEKESSEKRRQVLEILKTKARQLEGIYDDMIEDETK